MNAHFKEWSDVLAGPTPCGCEVHHHQLVPGVFQSIVESRLQKRERKEK